MGVSAEFDRKVVRTIAKYRGDAEQVRYEEDSYSGTRFVCSAERRTGNAPYRGGMSGLRRFIFVKHKVWAASFPFFISALAFAAAAALSASLWAIIPLLATTAVYGVTWVVFALEGDTHQLNEWVYKKLDTRYSSPVMTMLLERADLLTGKIVKEGAARGIVKEARSRMRDACALGRVEIASFEAARSILERYGCESTDQHIRHLLVKGTVPYAVEANPVDAQVFRARMETVRLQQQRVAELIVALEEIHVVEREARLVREQKTAAENALRRIESSERLSAASNVNADLTSSLRVLAEDRSNALEAERSALVEVENRVRGV